MKVQRFTHRALAILMSLMLALSMPAAAALGEQIPPTAIAVSASYTTADGEVMSFPADLMTDSEGRVDLYWIQVPDAAMLSLLSLSVEVWDASGMPVDTMSFEPDISFPLDMTASDAAPLSIVGTSENASVRFYVMATAPGALTPDPANPDDVDSFIYALGLEPTREDAGDETGGFDEGSRDEEIPGEGDFGGGDFGGENSGEGDFDGGDFGGENSGEGDFDGGDFGGENSGEGDFGGENSGEGDFDGEDTGENSPSEENSNQDADVPATDDIPNTSLPIDPATIVGRYVQASGVEGPAMLLQEPGVVDDSAIYLDSGEPLLVNTFMLSDSGDTYWLFVTRYITGEHGYVRVSDVSLPEDEAALLALYTPAQEPEAEKTQEPEIDEPQDDESGNPQDGEPSNPQDGEPGNPQDDASGDPQDGESGNPQDGESDSPQDGEPDIPQDGEPDSPQDGEPDIPQDGEPDSPQDGEPQVSNPEETVEPFSPNSFARVGKEQSALRSTPDSPKKDANVVTRYPKGTLVRIDDVVEGTDDWSAVTIFDEKAKTTATGFMMRSVLAPISQSEGETAVQSFMEAGGQISDETIVSSTDLGFDPSQLSYPQYAQPIVDENTPDIQVALLPAPGQQPDSGEVSFVPAGALLVYDGFETDDTGRIWFHATVYGTDLSGYVLATDASLIEEEAAQQEMARIDAEKNEPEGGDEAEPEGPGMPDGTPPDSGEGVEPVPPTEPDGNPSDGDGTTGNGENPEGGDPNQGNPNGSDDPNGIPPDASNPDDGNSEDDDKTSDVPDPDGDGSGDDDKTPTGPEVTEDPQELTLGDVYHYGRTNKDVNLRKDTSSKSSLLAELSNGTLLWVKQQVANNSGELWCSVKVVDTGKEGYILSKFVTLMGEVEEFNFRNSLEDPETRPEETESPKPEETESPKPEETESPKPEETPKPTPTPAPYAGYARTLYNNVFVRSVADANASTVATVSMAGTVVSVLDQQYVNGQRWHLVTYGDARGFVQDGEVQALTADEAKAYEESIRTPSPSPTATATSQPTATPLPFEGYAYTTMDNVVLRGNPNENAYIQTVIEKTNTVVYATKQEYTDGQQWHLVSYGNQWGYIHASQLRFMTYNEVKDYLASQVTPTPAPSTTPKPVDPNGASSYAITVKNKVNMREGASQSSKALTQLSANSLLLVMGVTSSGGYDWYKVDYRGTTGYVRGDMLSVMSVAELETYLKNGGSSGSSSTPGNNSNNNSSNNVEYTINGKPLATINPDQSEWTTPTITGMPDYSTPTPAPTETPEPTATPNPFGEDGEDEGPDGVEPTIAPVSKTESFKPPFLLLGIGIVLVGALASLYGFMVHRNNQRKEEERQLAQRRAQQQQQQRRAQQRPVDPNNPQRTSTVRPQGGQPRPGGTAGVTGAAGVSRTPGTTGTTGAAQRPTGMPPRPTGATGTSQANPYARPTGAPSAAPTGAPQRPGAPTGAPSAAPTGAPQRPVAPTSAPNAAPTGAPQRPVAPTSAPNPAPTGAPQRPVAPTGAPSAAPTGAPQRPVAPTGTPNAAPTGAPQRPVAPTGTPNPAPTGTMPQRTNPYLAGRASGTTGTTGVTGTVGATGAAPAKPARPANPPSPASKPEAPTPETEGAEHRRRRVRPKDTDHPLDL